MVVLSLLLFLLLFGGSCGVQKDDMSVIESGTALTDRLETLERLLMKQGADLKKLIAGQDAKLNAQKTMLQKQNAKLTLQEVLIRQLQNQLDYQGRLLRQHKIRFLHQQHLLFQQAKATEQLQNDSRLGGLGTESRVHKLFEKKGEKISATSVGMYDRNVEKTSSPRDVSKRSDDAGPLEMVVSQLSQKVTVMNADIQTLKNNDVQQNQHIQEARGSTFVQWGRSVCSSNNSQMVYTGVVGGSHYTHPGAATNFLCLTMSPIFSPHPPQKSSAYLYGAEYHTDDSYHFKDAVCAVCRSSFSTTIMVPGTNVCSPGWHLQYSGFLMAGRYDFQAGSEFICVDSSLEDRPGSDTDNGGKMLYYTATRCGSLPCSPYINNKTVTCAVCSK